MYRSRVPLPPPPVSLSMHVGGESGHLGSNMQLGIDSQRHVHVLCINL